MTEHPKWYIAVHYRSKRRTMNVAVALRGRSTGWGDGKPRRWFIGHHRHWAYHRGVELIWARPTLPQDRILFAYEWGASPKPEATP
jgi:hypothetical protein